MNIRKISALAAISVFAAATAYAKEIKIDANNTSYSEADVQKLAATAVGMGVKEPVSLNGGSGSKVQTALFICTGYNSPSLISRRSYTACASVPASTYSNSPPKGIPWDNLLIL